MHKNSIRRCTRIGYLAAALSLGAAAIHASVAPEHFHEWWGYGAFFVIAALVQGLLGIALVGTASRWALVAGITANLVFIVTYVVTRTAGIPFAGPHAGEVEHVSGVDVVTKLMELALILVLVQMWRMRWSLNSPTSAKQ